MSDQLSTGHRILVELAALRNETTTIRRSQDHLYKKISQVESKIVGNGKPGLQDRLVVIETKQESRERAKGPLIAITTAMMSFLIGIYTIITKHN